MVLIPFLGLGRNGVRVEFLPLVQVIIEGHGHGISLAKLVVADGGNTILVDEAVSAIHAIEQTRGMVAPVKQVLARHVAPMIELLSGPLILEYVEQMIPALPVDGAIRIEGRRNALRHHEMIAGTARIAQDSLSKVAGNQCRRIILSLPHPALRIQRDYFPVDSIGANETPNAVRFLHMSLPAAITGESFLL